MEVGTNPFVCGMLETGKHKKTLHGHKFDIRHFLYSPNGNYIASQSDISFWIWDVSTGKVKYQLTGHQSTYLGRPFAFSHDGTYLAAFGKDATILMWDVATRERKRTLKWHGLSMTFSPDGKYFASSSHYNTIQLWNVDDGEKVRTILVGGYIRNTIY